MFAKRFPTTHYTLTHTHTHIHIQSNQTHFCTRCFRRFLGKCTSERCNISLADIASSRWWCGSGNDQDDNDNGGISTSTMLLSWMLKCPEVLLRPTLAAHGFDTWFAPTCHPLSTRFECLSLYLESTHTVYTSTYLSNHPPTLDIYVYHTCSEQHASVWDGSSVACDGVSLMRRRCGECSQLSILSASIICV